MNFTVHSFRNSTAFEVLFLAVVKWFKLLWYFKHFESFLKIYFSNDHHLNPFVTKHSSCVIYHNLILKAADNKHNKQFFFLFLYRKHQNITSNQFLYYQNNISLIHENEDWIFYIKNNFSFYFKWLQKNNTLFLRYTNSTSKLMTFYLNLFRLQCICT